MVSRMHLGPAHHCSLIRSPRSLDGIAKHACQILEFIESVGLRLTRGLRQSFGFEFLDNLLVPSKRPAPLFMAEDLFERETRAHTTSVRIFSRIADEQLPNWHEAFRHTEHSLGFLLLAWGGNHV